VTCIGGEVGVELGEKEVGSGWETLVGVDKRFEVCVKDGDGSVGTLVPATVEASGKSS
jgi:hypothetical protein